MTEKPYAGVRLTVRCPNARLAAILDPMVRVWATRTGAAVEVVAAPLTPRDAADAAVLPFAEVGTWAARGDLLPVPAALRDPGHSYQWTAVFGVYRGEPYAGWGDQVLGLPLAGDGHVLVYRADRFADPMISHDFRTRFNRMIAAPTTWEDFADLAAFFADRDKRPSLPRLDADPARLAELFSRIAACYDRPAQTDTAPAAGAASSESLAFQFRPADGLPRLDTAGFRAAASWLAGLKARGTLSTDASADPVADLMEDRAIMAVLSLEELSRLKQKGTMPARYAVAALPGTRQVVNPATGALVPSGGNYVPYFAGGWLGVVRKTCPKPEAAFDLLAELGGPARSLEVIAAGGYGPFRDTHLDRERLLVWLGYGFDAERSRALQDALRAYVRKEVRNPTYGLRGPDHAVLTAALGTELKRITEGKVKSEDGLKQAMQAWEQASAGVPAEQRIAWRRHAAGLK